MSHARVEILKLIAEGKISPEEGERLIAALDQEQETRAEDVGPSKGWTDGIARALQEVAETVRHAVDDAVGATHKIFDEHRPETETVQVGGGEFTVPPGSRLKVQHAIRVSFGGSSKGGSVVLRTGQEDRVRIIRGQAVEVHRNGTDYVLTWAKDNLELEVPSTLADLAVRCMGGDLEVQQFPGPMSLETMGGELRVRSPRSGFRVRTLGGRARIVDMELQEGAATISSTGGDVQVDLSPAASMTIRATTLGGRIDFPPGTESETEGRARRRATCVIGGGLAAVTIDTLGGDVRVRQTEEEP
jgi:DUF4097 and DUF4098 domain-containing protein YvlB